MVAAAICRFSQWQRDGCLDRRFWVDFGGQGYFELVKKLLDAGHGDRGVVRHGGMIPDVMGVSW